MSQCPMRLQLWVKERVDLGAEGSALHRGNGEQAAAAARANTIMRRAATPAPAMSPAKCRNIGCDTTA
jgi:hypothetical protein